MNDIFIAKHNSKHANIAVHTGLYSFETDFVGGYFRQSTLNIFVSIPFTMQTVTVTSTHIELLKTTQIQNILNDFTRSTAIYHCNFHFTHSQPLTNLFFVCFFIILLLTHPTNDFRMCLMDFRSIYHSKPTNTNSLVQSKNEPNPYINVFIGFLYLRNRNGHEISDQSTQYIGD